MSSGCRRDQRKECIRVSAHCSRRRARSIRLVPSAGLRFSTNGPPEWTSGDLDTRNVRTALTFAIEVTITPLQRSRGAPNTPGGY
jgi:hypothetical protein